MTPDSFAMELWTWVREVKSYPDSSATIAARLVQRDVVKKIRSLYTLIGTAGRMYGGAIDGTDYIASLTQQFGLMINSVSDGCKFCHSLSIMNCIKVAT